jgi:hypothetical protein
MDARFFAGQCVATTRMTFAMRRFVRDVVDIDEASRRIRARLNAREHRFLSLVRRTVFARPSSTYARLFDAAGCSAAELEQLLARDGLEGGLATLADRGIFLTQAELKGRVDVVRGSLRFRPRPSEFHNPLNTAHFVSPTSGSTGRQQFVGRSFDEFSEIGDVIAVGLRTFGLDHPAFIRWSSLPHTLLGELHAGLSIIGWFNHVDRVPRLARLLQYWVWVVARLSGAPLAWPSDRPLTEPGEMARWLHTMRDAHGQLYVDATASSATRVSAAASRLGLRMHGIVWKPWGEPLTEARQATIVESGAQSMPVYSSVDTSTMGFACGLRRGADEVHLRSEAIVMLHRRHAWPGREVPGDALLVTNLSAAAPKVLINAETGESARFVDGECGCDFSAVGLTQRIVGIRSFEKLTGEGITLIGDSVIELFEDDLPAAFGGQLGDYQLAEVENERGMVRLVIRVHPSVGSIDPLIIRERVIRAIAARSAVEAHMASLLDTAGAIVVERAVPWRTSTGKLPAFVPLRRQSGN